MKKLILAAAGAAMFATPAMADSTSEIDVGANVPVECYVNNLPANVTFGDLTRRGQAAAVVASGIEVFCNQRSTVSVTSDQGYLKALTNDSGNDSISESDFTSANNPGFAAGLDYSATVPNFNTYGGPFSADTSQVTAGNAVTLSNVPALNDPNVAIRFRTIPGTLPLLGTTYNDEVTLSITATGV